MKVKSAARPYCSPRRAAQADKTRTDIVTAACTLLGGGKDLPAFSLDQVARQAGVTRLTVYNQFESKQGLLEAVFDTLAETGGLAELPAVFSETDPGTALRRFVSVFCRFWGANSTVIARLAAIMKLDNEIATSLTQRSERRRQALTVLVSRLIPAADKINTDLIDVLFALTSFEMFEALATRSRGANSIVALLQTLVDQTVNTFAGSQIDSVRPPTRRFSSRP